MRGRGAEANAHIQVRVWGLNKTCRILFFLLSKAFTKIHGLKLGDVTKDISPTRYGLKRQAPASCSLSLSTLSTFYFSSWMNASLPTCKLSICRPWYKADGSFTNKPPRRSPDTKNDMQLFSTIKHKLLPLFPNFLKVSFYLGQTGQIKIPEDTTCRCHRNNTWLYERLPRQSRRATTIHPSG